MILVGLGIAIIMVIVSIILAKHYWSNDEFTAIGIMMCIITSALIVTLIIIGVIDLAKINTEPAILQEQIQILEDENSEIEAEITRVVYDYKDYEQQTYEMLLADTGNAIAVANVIPSLSSNELVVEEMRIYNENRKQIADLKMQLVDIERTRWELYFGN